MCIKPGELALCGAFSKGPSGKCKFSSFSAELSVRDRGESARFLRCFCNIILVKGPMDMRPVLINRRGQWTFHNLPMYTYW